MIFSPTNWKQLKDLLNLALKFLSTQHWVGGWLWWWPPLHVTTSTTHHELGTQPHWVFLPLSQAEAGPPQADQRWVGVVWWLCGHWQPIQFPFISARATDCCFQQHWQVPWWVFLQQPCSNTGYKTYAVHFHWPHLHLPALDCQVSTLLLFIYFFSFFVCFVNGLLPWDCQLNDE